MGKRRTGSEGVEVPSATEMVLQLAAPQACVKPGTRAASTSAEEGRTAAPGARRKRAAPKVASVVEEAAAAPTEPREGRRVAREHEINELCAALAPVLERVACPVRFVLATGDNLGAERGEMERVRATLDAVLTRNPNLKVSAKVASNHSHILSKDFRAIAAAVRKTAAACDQSGRCARRRAPRRRRARARDGAP